MATTAASFNTLHQELVAGRLLIICGTGVTAASVDSKLASWTGLIEDAIDKAVALGVRDEEWATRAKADAKSIYSADMIAAAEKVTEALGGRRGGDFAGWLTDTVGQLGIATPDLASAVAELAEQGALVATTNYDDILEEATGLPVVTWRQGSRLRRVVRGEERAVVHIHGHWSDPESVVFGAASYADVVSDGASEAFLRATLYAQTVLFVGYGAGLDDPNFAALRRWLRERMDDGMQHYRLVRSADEPTIAAQHASESIRTVVYGDTYDELPTFLRALSSAGGASTWFRALELMPVNNAADTPPGDAAQVHPPTGTAHIELPQRAASAADRLFLREAAAQLQHTRALQSDDEAAAGELTKEGDEWAKTVVLEQFAEEIGSVIEAAERSDQLPADRAELAVRWGRRILAIVASSAAGGMFPLG